MALIICTECGKDISDTALTCPHCGAIKSKEKKVRRKPLPLSRTSRKRKMQWSIWGMAALLSGILIIVVIAHKGWRLETAPIPRVTKKSLNADKSDILDYKATIHATIKNEGGPGTVSIVFLMHQKGKE